MLSRRNNFNKNRRLSLGKRKFIYSKKTYSNPFFNRKSRARLKTTGLSNKNKLAIFALIIIALIMIWLLFFSNLFKLNVIEVRGVDSNMAAAVEAMAWGVAEDRLIGKNNLLLYNKSELSNMLNEKYYLASLIIKRKLLHTLAVNLKEKQPAAVWREDNLYYYIDIEGKIINQIDPLNISGNAFPLIENLTDIKIDSKKANINKPIIDYIINLFNEYKDKKHNFEIERFVVDKEINTAKMVVLGGPTIYFNIKDELKGQAEKLDLIIKDKLYNSFKTKEYIDLRYANNVYIK